MVQTGVHDAAEYLLRHRLFDELLKDEKFLEAANCLGKLNLDTMSSKVRSASYISYNNRHYNAYDWCKKTYRSYK